MTVDRKRIKYGVVVVRGWFFGLSEEVVLLEPYKALCNFLPVEVCEKGNLFFNLL